MNLTTLTWHRCARCDEPVDPANVLTIRPWHESPAGTWPRGVRPAHYHPGGWAGCVAAAKDYHRGELDRALDRIYERMADEPLPADPLDTLARCTHRGAECIERHRAQLPAADDELATRAAWGDR